MGHLIKQNFESVMAAVDVAVQKSGRKRSEVTVVAVTKYVDAETTKKLVECGHSVLGESRPQVLWEKSKALAEQNVEWHLIGHLQRNKVAKTISRCHLIHSVDSIRLMRAINDAVANDSLPSRCLLEINISGETAKHGFEPDELEAAIEEARNFPNLQINGLMGMGGIGETDGCRGQFASLRKLLERFQPFNEGNIDLKELSMGMSGDFEDAIMEGATLVRIGSSFFKGAF